MDTLIIILIIAVVPILLYAISGFAGFVYTFLKRQNKKSKASKKNKQTSIEKMLDTRDNPRQEEFDRAYFRGKDFVTTMPREEIVIKSQDGLDLNGYYFNGKNSNHEKICILFHGYRSNVFHDFCGAAIDYYENGTDMLMVDQRAHGKSQGKIITMGIKERYDCLEWCKYVANRYPNAKITLCGISMGATTVLMASALKLPENVKAIIADCGFSDPFEIVKKIAKDMKLPFTFIYPAMNLWAKLIGDFTMKEFSTIKAMEQNSLPILFVHGTGDNFVPHEMTVKCYNACKTPKKLMLIEGAFHGYSYLFEYERMKEQEMKWLNGNFD